MAWRIEIGDKAKKDLAALDKVVAKRITAFLRERVAQLDDPRSIGEALKGSKLGAFWKYRVGDYLLASRKNPRKKPLNNFRGNKVSEDNLDKTRRLMGQKVYEFSKRRNQSTRWTHDPAMAVELYLPE